MNLKTEHGLPAHLFAKGRQKTHPESRLYRQQKTPPKKEVRGRKENGGRISQEMHAYTFLY
jgi:hypothetical protein